MAFFLRGRRRAGRFLEWKVRLFGAGAALAVAGMALENRWIVGAAIVVLVAGFLLRFLPDDGDHGNHGGDDRREDDPGGPHR